MRIACLMGALCLVALTFGCSSYSVNHDWDRDAPFPTYKTYNWLDISRPEPGSIQAARSRNDLLEGRIKRAVNSELAKKGLTFVNDNPDLLVVYHTGVESKINVTDWGYRYSYDYWGWGGRQIDVYQYQEGTLIVDLIENATKELVWRGYATRTVDENWSPEKEEQVINTAVGKIFKKYPPK
ncbi:MAG: DUF4136 domain-containing protein [Candidatus Latescibacterota bacterium]|nr:MAG: DUF4136 domain-containing protein [Candidatus Latescibacterota bacterium]